MFDLRRLTCLHAVHVHGSVLDAALELGLTSSAVSQQIGKLEREVGAPLLERAGRGVILTDAALILVEATDEIVASMERATARLEDTREDLSGTLRVASFPSGIVTFAAPAIAAMRTAAPRLSIRLSEMFPDRAHDAAVGGHVDVALVHEWGTAPPQGLDFTVIGDDPVRLLLPADHRFVDEGQVPLSALVDDVWVTDDLEGFCRKWLVRQMADLGRRPRIDYRVDELAAQIALIGAGLCVGVLPRIALGDLPAGVRPLDIAGESPRRRIYAVYREGSSRRPAVRRFIDEVRRRLTDVHMLESEAD